MTTNGTKLQMMISEPLPQISYFPTFLFDFPDRTRYLSNAPASYNNNEYYRRIVQDILDSTDRNLTIEDHIVARIERTIKSDTTWDPFKFFKSNEKSQIDHVMLLISTQITRTVFDSWNEIFGVRMRNKTIDVKWNIEQDPGTTDKSIYIEFYVVDGELQYAVSERSLGFRWFFCFLRIYSVSCFTDRYAQYSILVR